MNKINYNISQVGLYSIWNKFTIYPALLRQATYGTIKFGIYHCLKQIVNERRCGREDMLTRVTCAALAGMVSSSLANPTDVLKVRLQVNKSCYLRRNTFDSFKDIYINEGVRGLWKGVLPTSQRAGIIAAAELPLYDCSKNFLMPIIGDNAITHLSSGFVAGFGSAVVSTPIDVIRTRIMAQRLIIKRSQNSQLLSHGYLYRGAFHCLFQTVKYEGLFALYRGFIPTWVRMGPWNIIFFATYEQLKVLY